MPRQLPCAKFHSNHFTTTWMRAEWNFLRIWIMMEKSFMKWAYWCVLIINLPGLEIFEYFVSLSGLSSGKTFVKQSWSSPGKGRKRMCGDTISPSISMTQHKTAISPMYQQSCPKITIFYYVFFFQPMAVQHLVLKELGIFSKRFFFWCCSLWL